MDAVSAVSLVATTIDLIKTVKDVFARVRDFLSRTEEVPKAFQRLHRRLPFLLTILEDIREQADRGEVSPKQEMARRVIEDCAIEMKSLDSQLRNLLPKPEDSDLAKMKKALKSLRSDSRISSTVKEVNKCFEDLQLYQNTCINTKSDQILSLGARTLSRSDELMALAIVSKPSVLQEQLDVTVGGTALGPVSSASGFQMLPHAQQFCTCDYRKPRLVTCSNFMVSNLEISHSTTNAHKPSCHLYIPTNDEKRASFRFKLPQYLLRRATFLVWSCDYGAGGLSLSSRLDYKGIIRQDSPAFAVIRSYKDIVGFDHPEQFSNLQTHILEHIERLFRDGKASPFEVNTDGRTLSLELLHMSWTIRPVHWKFIFYSTIQLIKGLTKLGVPLDEYEGMRGMTVLENIVLSISLRSGRQAQYDFTSEGNLANEIIQLGAQITRPPPYIPHRLDWLKILKFIPELPEVYHCNNLHLAILRRSPVEIQRIVKINPSCIHEKMLFDRQALHLAGDWPWALEFLLKCGADASARDWTRQTSLDYAIQFRNLDSVKLLLARKIPLTVGDYCWNNTLDIAAEHFDPEIFKQIAQVVAARRKELVSYAKTVLSLESLQDLPAMPETVPDEGAIEISDVLKKNGHKVDHDYYYIIYKSVYDCLRSYDGQHIEIYELLFDTGFTNIGNATHAVMDHEASTSTIIHWLLAKGASLAYLEENLERRAYGYRLVHTFAICLATEPCNNWANDEYLSQSVLLVLDPQYAIYTDSCRCLCSTSGCSSASLLVKICWNIGWPGTRILDLESFDDVAEILEEPESRTMFFTALIRIALFESLGLRHLCCIREEFEYPWMESPLSIEEYEELKEEDKFLAEEFETLLAQAMQEWEVGGSKFAKFWPDFYNRKVRPRRTENDEAHIKAANEIGVCLEHVSPDEDSQRWKRGF